MAWEISMTNVHVFASRFTDGFREQTVQNRRVGGSLEHSVPLETARNLDFREQRELILS